MIKNYTEVKSLFLNSEILKSIILANLVRLQIPKHANSLLISTLIKQHVRISTN